MFSFLMYTVLSHDHEFTLIIIIVIIILFYQLHSSFLECLYQTVLIIVINRFWMFPKDTI